MNFELWNVVLSLDELLIRKGKDLSTRFHPAERANLLIGARGIILKIQELNLKLGVLFHPC